MGIGFEYNIDFEAPIKLASIILNSIGFFTP